MRDLKRGAFDFLAKRPDWSLTSDVARALGVSRVTIVQYLRELLGKGLVERKRLEGQHLAGEASHPLRQLSRPEGRS